MMYINKTKEPLGSFVLYKSSNFKLKIAPTKSFTINAINLIIKLQFKIRICVSNLRIIVIFKYLAANLSKL